MAITEDRTSIEKRSPTPTSRDAEKDGFDAAATVLTDSVDGDEALQLVGKERTAQFSEEYNRRLRRKLVCNMLYNVRRVGLLIGILGLYHTPSVCRCVFHPILVSLQSLLVPIRVRSKVVQGQDVSQLCEVCRSIWRTFPHDLTRAIAALWVSPFMARYAEVRYGTPIQLADIRRTALQPRLTSVLPWVPCLGVPDCVYFPEAQGSHQPGVYTCVLADRVLKYRLANTLARTSSRGVSFSCAMPLLRLLAASSFYVSSSVSYLCALTLDAILIACQACWSPALHLSLSMSLACSTRRMSRYAVSTLISGR